MASASRSPGSSTSCFTPTELTLLTGAASFPYRGSQLCQTPHCVNPGHWGFTPTITQGPDDEPQTYPDEPPEDTGWTIEEATEFVDQYLVLEPTMPFIRDHNLLIDIPDDLLREALALANKEHFLS